MNELRVYSNPTGAGEHVTFYSRRADGPFYCWRYEGAAGQWHVGRVHLPDLKALRATKWRSVPPELQARMIDHYLE